MTQGQDVPAVQQKPTLTEIVRGWNLVTDNIKPLVLYLAKEDVLTMGEVGAVDEALDVISNVLRANLRMHNEGVLKETARRAEAEDSIRTRLKAKQDARDDGDHGEVVKTVKVNSKKNDPPAEPEAHPKPKWGPGPEPVAPDEGEVEQLNDGESGPIEEEVESEM